MSRDVIPDHHFGDTNIVEYCDRSVSAPDEKNTVLVTRQYQLPLTLF